MSAWKSSSDDDDELGASSASEDNAYRPRRTATRGISRERLRHGLEWSEDEKDLNRKRTSLHKSTSGKCNAAVEQSPLSILVADGSEDDVISIPPPDQAAVKLPIGGSPDQTAIGDGTLKEEDIFSICPPPPDSVLDDEFEGEDLIGVEPPPAFLSDPAISGSEPWQLDKAEPFVPEQQLEEEDRKSPDEQITDMVGKEVLGVLDVYTSTETAEETSGDEVQERPKRQLPLTEKEIITAGLLGHTRAPTLKAVDFGPPKGRGVVALEPITKGAYVCEYRTYRVYPVGSPEETEMANEYVMNGEGSYVLQTAYVIPQFGARLCFDATRRFKDIGRLINHSSVGCNLKPGQPLFVRGKWRVGMVAVRNIVTGQELTYDYGVRTEEWMKESSGVREMRKAGEICGCALGADESSGGGQRAGESSGGADVFGRDSESLEEEETGHTEDVQILEGSSTEQPAQLPHYKRNYFWCPQPNCTSGPVQKMTQHLQKKHRMSAATAVQVARKKRRAPVEAVRLKIPNPHTRSSGLQHLGLFSEKMLYASPSTTTSTTACGPFSPPVPTPDTTSTSTSLPPPTSPCTPSTSGHDGKFHNGGPFLDGLYSHLRTRAGGNRGNHSAGQITRYVGKYLYSLNVHKVEEGGLLRTSPVVPYLETVQAAGIGSSGILHRILAHKAAVQFMRLGMVEDAQLRTAERMIWHLGQVEKTFKVEKQKEARDLLLHQSLDGGSGSMVTIENFKEDPQVLQTFKAEATRLLQGHVSRSRYNVCLGLLAARLMLCNAQRPSSITGMTRQELDEGIKRRKLGDTQRAVIVVREHKTGRKESALLVADATNIQMILLWLRVLTQISPTCTLAFPDFEGKPMAHLERKVEMAARTLGHDLPTATSFRKELEIRNKRQDGPMREAVSRALSHSLATAQQYYQAPTISDAYRAYEVMQQIIGGARAESPPAIVEAERKGKEKEKGKGKRVRQEEEEESYAVLSEEEERVGKKKRKSIQHDPEEEERVGEIKKWNEEVTEAPPDKKVGSNPSISPPTPRKRRGFTKQQESLVEDYFSKHIADRNYPTLAECRDFINLYPTFAGRKPKDIYDKCRNLAGR